MQLSIWAFTTITVPLIVWLHFEQTKLTFSDRWFGLILSLLLTDKIELFFPQLSPLASKKLWGDFESSKLEAAWTAVAVEEDEVEKEDGEEEEEDDEEEEEEDDEEKDEENEEENDQEDEEEE